MKTAILTLAQSNERVQSVALLGTSFVDKWRYSGIILKQGRVGTQCMAYAALSGLRGENESFQARRRVSRDLSKHADISRDLSPAE